MSDKPFTGAFGDKPFLGCFDILDGMISDGSLDRFNDLADKRSYPRFTLTIYQDGTFNVQSETDAAFEASAVPDYVTSIPLSVLLPEIDRVTKKAL